MRTVEWIRLGQRIAPGANLVHRTRGSKSTLCGITLPKGTKPQEGEAGTVTCPRCQIIQAKLNHQDKQQPNELNNG